VSAIQLAQQFADDFGARAASARLKVSEALSRGDVQLATHWRAYALAWEQAETAARSVLSVEMRAALGGEA
jgi:hypothetical protein